MVSFGIGIVAGVALTVATAAFIGLVVIDWDIKM